MIFKSIWFSNTDEYKCLQKKLVNKKISFFITNNNQPWKGKIANIIVLIGENGMGKTSLLSCLKKLFCMFKRSIKNVDMNKCSLRSNLLHNGDLKNTIINDLFSDRNYLYTNFIPKKNDIPFAMILVMNFLILSKKMVKFCNYVDEDMNEKNRNIYCN